jgi:2-methylisocitrate lyase-like PEP mutase family enzyme
VYQTTTGVYDGISARLALEAGFDVLYMSGAATTASMLGQPDLAIATQNDFIQVVFYFILFFILDQDLIPLISYNNDRTRV